MVKLLRIDQRTCWEDCLEEFLLVKRAQGLVDRTLKDYDWHVRRFFVKFPNVWGSSNELKKAVIRYFAEGRDLSPATHNIRRKYLKAFFEWAVQEDLLTSNPTGGIPQRREEPRVRHLSEGQLKELLDAPDKKTYAGLRDYAMLCLTLDTGIRPKEALALKPDDINLRSLEVRIPASIAKTRISRTLPITPVTANALKRLLSVRPESWEDAPAISSADGGKMNTSSWTHR